LIVISLLVLGAVSSDAQSSAPTCAVGQDASIPGFQCTLGGLTFGSFTIFLGFNAPVPISVATATDNKVQLAFSPIDERGSSFVAAFTVTGTVSEVAFSGTNSAAEICKDFNFPCFGGRVLGDLFFGRFVSLPPATSNFAIIFGCECDQVPPASFVFLKGCQVDVLPWSQFGSAWKCDVYDQSHPYFAGPASAITDGLLGCNIPPVAFRMGNRGCALTSLAMALRFAGISDILTFPPFATFNPGSLNKFMSNTLFGLPLPGGEFSPGSANSTDGHDVIFDVTTRLIGLNHSDPQLMFKSAGAFDSVLDPTDAYKALDGAVCTDKRPIVVGVTGSGNSFAGHYVLVYGRQERSTPGSIPQYLIADPGHQDPIHLDTGGLRSLDDYLDPVIGLPKFVTRGVVTDPPNDVSGLDLAAGHAVEILVTDPNGKRTGFDEAGGRVLQDIPQSAYFRDALDDDSVPEAATGYTHSVQIFQPLQGPYQVTVTGLTFGSYGLLLAPFTQDGSAQAMTLFSGVTGPGSNSTIQIQLNSSPGAVSVVTLVASFASTLSDIVNSLHLGLIDKSGISNSLSEKIGAAQDATGLARNNILNAFKNEVNAQSGKHITGIAVQILLDDAESLINQSR